MQRWEGGGGGGWETDRKVIDVILHSLAVFSSIFLANYLLSACKFPATQFEYGVINFKNIKS
jgi:hypothetical protein